MSLKHDDFLDAIGFGYEYQVSKLIEWIQAAATSDTTAMEATCLQSAILVAKRLSNYKKVLSFSMQASVLDSFVATFLGSLPEEKKIYYAAISLLWRGSVSHILQVLEKRLSQC